MFLALLLVIFVIVDIFWDVYFVLDGFKYNNNFMKQNYIYTLVGAVILMSETIIWHFHTRGSNEKCLKNIKPSVVALIDDYFILDL